MSATVDTSGEWGVHDPQGCLRASGFISSGEAGTV